MGPEKPSRKSVLESQSNRRTVLGYSAKAVTAGLLVGVAPSTTSAEFVPASGSTEELLDQRVADDAGYRQYHSHFVEKGYTRDLANSKTGVLRWDGKEIDSAVGVYRRSDPEGVVFIRWRADTGARFLEMSAEDGGTLLMGCGADAADCDCSINECVNVDWSCVGNCADNPFECTGDIIENERDCCEQWECRDYLEA